MKRWTCSQSRLFACLSQHACGGRERLGGVERRVDGPSPCALSSACEPTKHKGLVSRTDSVNCTQAASHAISSLLWHCRSRLAAPRFGQFLQAIKELNSGAKTREQTLQQARDLFGTSEADLYGKPAGPEPLESSDRQVACDHHSTGVPAELLNFETCIAGFITEASCYGATCKRNQQLSLWACWPVDFRPFPGLGQSMRRAVCWRVALSGGI